MRFIDNTLLSPPQNWQGIANAALAAVQGGADVNDFGNVWRALKDVLAEASHGKCWYCEIPQTRSDNAVDHFRPKSLYRWLAFALSNLRFSCTYCNSRRVDTDTGITGGKGDNFPLAEFCQRATSPGEEGNEHPLLLNPCNASDPGLLDFNDDGRPVPRHPEHENRKLRAETSIRLYHLDHTDLVEERRRLAVSLQQKIDAANKLYDRVDAGDAAIDQSYAGHVRDLKRAMAERAELSMFARKVIAGRRELPWVEALFQT